MKFHESEEFQNAIEATAQGLSMRPAFVEKDYWVSFALKNLSVSDQQSTTVFKGGTSLSKVYNCIERFSEDVDLAIISREESPSQMAIKRQLKAVEQAASKGLKLLNDPPPVKRGKNRFSCFEYPRALEEEVFSVAPYIRLEITAFNNPVPNEEFQIQSYLAAYLAEEGFKDHIEQYELQPFPLLVLSIERTFCEKILSLIRLSYRGVDDLKSKIRHFHDLALIKESETIKTMISNKDYSILDSAFADDKGNTTFQGEWTEKSFIKAPLFQEFDEIWKQLKDIYLSELSILSWADQIPSESDIRNTISMLESFLSGYKLE